VVHYVAFLDSAMEIRPIRLGVIRAHCLAGSSGSVVPPCRQYPLSLSSQMEEVGEFRERVLFRVEAMFVVSKLVVVFDSHAVAVDELTVAIFLCQAIEIAASEHGVEPSSYWVGRCSQAFCRSVCGFSNRCADNPPSSIVQRGNDRSIEEAWEVMLAILSTLHSSPIRND